MHGVPDPSRVRFEGPLAPFVPGLVVELASLGYTRTSVTMRMRLVGSLSRWLDAAGISLGELTGPVMERFLSERRARGASHYSLRALAPIVDYLRRVGVVSAVVASAPPVTVVEVLLERFARYLLSDRCDGPTAKVSHLHSITWRLVAHDGLVGDQDDDTAGHHYLLDLAETERELVVQPHTVTDISTG